MTIVIENQYIPLFPVIVEAGEFCLAAGRGERGHGCGGSDGWAVADNEAAGRGCWDG